MEIADIRKLKELTDENRRLKQMYADLSLKHEALKDIIEKSSEACCEMRTCHFCTAGTWAQPASGV